MLGYGAGAVGGLFTKGAAADQERAIARAVELGINYIDTAALYGNGESERNLGRVLKALKPDVVLGTKFRLKAADRAESPRSVAQSMDESLKRLGLDHVDLLPAAQSAGRQGRRRPHGRRDRAQRGRAGAAQAAEGGQDALHRLQRRRRAGGDPEGGRIPRRSTPCRSSTTRSTPAPAGRCPRARRASTTAACSTAPRRPTWAPSSSARWRAARWPAPRRAIRSPCRSVDPIGSAPNFAGDVARAKQLEPLVREGVAGSLTELAQRFVIAHPAVSTMLVGYSTLDQLEQAAAAVEKGPLPSGRREDRQVATRRCTEARRRAAR